MLVVEEDALEHIGGAVELRIACFGDLIPLLGIECIQRRSRALDGEKAFFIGAHGHDDVRGDALLMNDLVAGGVVLDRKSTRLNSSH